MPLVDKPLDELRAYTGRNPRPADFDACWAEALRELAAADPRAELVPNKELNARHAECFNLRFTGVGGARVHAMYPRPRQRRNSNRGPAVLPFHGYSGTAGDWNNGPNRPDR